MVIPEPSAHALDPLYAAASIVVAVDGSLAARTAAGVAIQLAQVEAMTVRGLYVVDQRLIMDPYARSDKELGAAQGLVSRPELVARFEERGRAALRWLEASCRDAHVPVSADLVLGAVPEVVAEAAAAAELLALGRRGLGHSDDARHLGRNLRAVMRHTTGPVLIGGDERRAIRRVLLVYDSSRRNERALAWTAAFHRSLTSLAVVLAPRAETPASGATSLRDAIEADLEANGLTNYSVVHGGDRSGSEIIATAAESNVDLIVIGERRRSMLARSLLGPVLEDVLGRCGLPVLAA
jgi:nucleotide-binding universal stress UspA family protein